MIAVVADASVLVGELQRPRGRELLRHPELSVLVAEDQWEETKHELARRLDLLASTSRISEKRRSDLENDVQALIDEEVIEVVPRVNYLTLRDTALRRVPRDERDWPTVALAISLTQRSSRRTTTSSAAAARRGRSRR